MVISDYVAYLLIAAAGFFFVVAIGLLYRYRLASQKLNESTDLGRDLWEALDQRMKRQDQRIIDMMTRVEVLQARAMSAAAPTPPLVFPSPSPSVQIPPPVAEAPKAVNEPAEPVAPESRPVTTSQPATAPQLESQSILEPMKQSEPMPPPLPASPRQIKLDKTARAALEMLKDKPLTTEDLWKALNLGREHTSRVMKKLFELGLVTRDEADKPYTYQLTDEGRRFV